MVALLKNGNEIIRVVDGETLPGGIYDNGGLSFSGDVGIGWTSGPSIGGVYSANAAEYTDTPEQGKTQTGVDLAQWSIVDGVAKGPRTWQAVTLEVPVSVRRAAAVEAMVRAGMVNPEASIASAIAALPEGPDKWIIAAKVSMPDWVVSDLIANAGLLGMTADQVTGLAIAASGL